MIDDIYPEDVFLLRRESDYEFLYPARLQKELSESKISDPRLSIYIQCRGERLRRQWVKMISEYMYPECDILDIYIGEKFRYDGQEIINFIGGVDASTLWSAESYEQDVNANTVVKKGGHKISTQKGAVLSIFDSYPVDALNVCDFTYQNVMLLKLVHVINFVTGFNDYMYFRKDRKRQARLSEKQADRLLQCVIIVEGDDYTMLFNNATDTKSGFRPVYRGRIHFDSDAIPPEYIASPVIKRLNMVKALLKKEGMEVHNGVPEW